MSSRYPAPAKGVSHFYRSPLLPGAELRVSHFEAVGFPKHSHETYSLGLILAGRSRTFLRGGQREVQAGEVVLIEPGEVHACNPEPYAGESGGWSYRMLHLEPELLTRALGRAEGQPLKEPLFRRAVSRDETLKAALTVFTAALIAGADLLVLDETLAELGAALTPELCEQGESAAHGERTAGSDVGHGVDRVLDWLREAPGRTFRLDELAAEAGMSPHALSRAVKRATGFTPHGYQRELRMGLARRLLARGETITDVALAVGFTDQAHFTNVFRAVTGTTPGTYQKGGAAEG